MLTVREKHKNIETIIEEAATGIALILGLGDGEPLVELPAARPPLFLRDDFSN